MFILPNYFVVCGKADLSVPPIYALVSQTYLTIKSLK